MRGKDDQVGMTTPGTPQSPFRTAGGALVNWWRAATLDALIVGVLWLIGLELIRVPLAPFWALLGAMLQIIPTFGGMIALIGPVLSVAFQGSEDWWRLGLVLGLYGVIAILEGLVIGPYVLHRTTSVPWWAALLGPIVLGIVIPFWGVLLAPPLLAVFFALRDRHRNQQR
jgi:predicted PurR-regulated permease PerM